MSDKVYLVLKHSTEVFGAFLTKDEAQAYLSKYPQTASVKFEVKEVEDARDVEPP